MNKWVGNIQGIRKWSVMVLIVIASLTFRVLDFLDGDQLVTLLSNTVVAFMSSNAVEYVRDMVTSKKKD